MIMKDSLFSGVAGLVGDRRGTTVMVWALGGAALLVMTGLALDCARAEAVKHRLQSAADAAALVAARNAAAPFAERQVQARAFFDETIRDMALAGPVNFRLIETRHGHRVEATMTVNATLAGLVRAQDWTVRVASAARP
ncbi:MAG: pilus assembly protein TadG-related protein [Hyphomonadaceae bacterium]|nr:pilus assembly protein TadG-related protein [Hyphomonadaceae bacterium]